MDAPFQLTRLGSMSCGAATEKVSARYTHVQQRPSTTHTCIPTHTPHMNMPHIIYLHTQQGLTRSSTAMSSALFYGKLISFSMGQGMKSRSLDVEWYWTCMFNHISNTIPPYISPTQCFTLWYTTAMISDTEQHCAGMFKHNSTLDLPPTLSHLVVQNNHHDLRHGEVQCRHVQPH